MYKRILEYFKFEAENVIVFHDDLDIEFERLKQNLEVQVLVTMV